MRRRFLAVFLMVCGLAAPAHAALVSDRLEQVMPDGTLLLQQTGPARLQGVLLQEGAVAWLRAREHQPVLLRQRGTDRYGRAELVIVESRSRQALSWQEQLLHKKLALTYDRAALPKKWLKAEKPPATIAAMDAAKHIGQFVVLEGRVTRSYKGRDMWYFNFGEDWKTDTSLRIPRRAWRAFGKDFAIADGTRVIARGALLLDNGPMLELTRPEQLQQPDKMPPEKPTKPKSKKVAHADAR